MGDILRDFKARRLYQKTHLFTIIFLLISTCEHYNQILINWIFYDMKSSSILSNEYHKCRKSVKGNMYIIHLTGLIRAHFLPVLNALRGNIFTTRLILEPNLLLNINWRECSICWQKDIMSCATSSRLMFKKYIFSI